jgi:hypothetical protein
MYTIWIQLSLFLDNEYLDIKATQDDIDLLGRFVKYLPKSVSNLKGLKISEQIKIIKILLDKYKYNPAIALCILENKCININTEFDPLNLIILEISVRKQVFNTSEELVDKILGTYFPTTT